VDVKKQPVTLARFGEFRKTLYVPTSINVFALKGISSKAAIVLDAKLVFGVVNAYFGGTQMSRRAQIVGREFTRTEQRVIQLILGSIIDAIRESWKQLEAVEFLLLESEMNPVATNAYVSTDTLMISTFRIDLRGEGGEAQVLMPGSMIESIFHQQAEAAVLESNHTIMRRRALAFESTLSGEIRGEPLTLGELLRLSVGSVLAIAPPERIELKVNGISKYAASMGESRGRVGLRILERGPGR
jgi:flagellar motor switch protein FliM